MRLAYLSSARIPDDWAHVLQILTMCEAFADAGAEVELVVPRRANTPRVDPYRYAGVKPNFKITRLFCIDLFPGTESPFWYWVRTLSFLLSAKCYLAFHRHDVVYTREHQAGLFFSDFVYEVHAVPNESAVYRRLVRHARGLVVLTSFIRDRFVKQGIPKDRIHIAPDAVDAAKFDVALSQAEARAQTSLPLDAYIVGYAGTLKTMEMEKGVAATIRSLRELPENVVAVIVGGETAHIEEYKALAQEEGVGDRVRFIGKVPHERIATYLKAFDVAVAPFPDFEHYRYFMSPLKVFEYMAAGVPMIVSDLPSFREVLTERVTMFIPPADPSALAEAVADLKEHPERAREMAEAAGEEAKTRFSWKARARGILSFIAGAHA